MNSLDNLYEQYHILAENLLDMGNSDFTTDLMQYGVTRNYYERINGATESLCEFYDKYLQNDSIRDAVSDRLQDKRSENVKFCLLIDVLRCYDGLDHPTSFTTPEGVALMILLGKVLGIGEINRYEKLEDVNSATLNRPYPIHQRLFRRIRKEIFTFHVANSGASDARYRPGLQDNIV